MTFLINKILLKRKMKNFHSSHIWIIQGLNLINMVMIKIPNFLETKLKWKLNFQAQKHIRYQTELRFCLCQSISTMENASLRDKSLEIYSSLTIKKLSVGKHTNVLINWIILQLHSSMMSRHSKTASEPEKHKKTSIK